MLIKGAAVLWMPRAIDLANWANVPLAVDMNVSKMVALEAGF